MFHFMVKISRITVAYLGSKHYLYFVNIRSSVHTAGNIDSVTPDVVLWLACPNDTGHYWTDVYTCNV